MVGNDPDGNIPFVFPVVFLAGNLAYLVPQRTDRVNVKDGVHILHHGGKTLQSHSGVDVLLFQFAVVSLTVIVKLGKHIVPDLNVAVTVAAHLTVRLAAAVLFPSVIIDLRAGAAGAGAVLPEIILLAETVNPLCGNADLFIPDLESLVVLHINGRIKALLVKPYHLRQKLPGPGDGLMLEIVPERKIPQHFKKGAVSGCLSDIFDVRGTDTFLAGRHPFPGRDLLSGKVWL